jgi:hypothetical protein
MADFGAIRIVSIVLAIALLVIASSSEDGLWRDGGDRNWAAALVGVGRRGRVTEAGCLQRGWCRSKVA